MSSDTSGMSFMSYLLCSCCSCLLFILAIFAIFGWITTTTTKAAGQAVSSVLAGNSSGVDAAGNPVQTGGSVSLLTATTSSL